MKPAGLPLLALALAGALPADEPPVATPAKTSVRLTQEIRAVLPKFTLPPPPVLDQPKDPGPDPEVLQLPKLTVKEKRPPGHDPDLWQSDAVIQHKAMLAYQDSLTPLEWALNSWYIPIFGSPPSARGHAFYEQNKMNSQISLMNHVADVHRMLDAKNSALLKKAVNEMNQADDWHDRPAGEGRAK